MIQFSQAQQKLNKLFNQANLNDSDLKNKDNKNIVLSFFKTTMQAFTVLDDTGWISAKPERITDDLTHAGYTTTKSKLLPELLRMIIKISLTIPEVFLPYLDIICVLKGQKPENFANYYPYESSTYTDDWLLIKTDGNTVYNGPYSKLISYIYSFPVFSFDDLTTYDIPYYKKIWYTDFRYTDSGDDYRILGQLIYAQSFTKNSTVACGDNTTTFICSPLSLTTGVAVPLDTIDDITGSTITGHCKKTVSTWSGSPTPTNTCVSTDVDTVAVQSFDVLGGYSWYVSILGTLQKMVGGDWVTQSTGLQYDRTLVTTGSNPSFNDTVLLGYVPHYTAGTDGAIRVNTSSDIQLISFPDSSHTITLEKNPDGYPITSSPTKHVFKGII